MTSHTPGPWSVYEDANKVAAHGAKNLISSSAYGDYYTESITDERGEFFNPADARLIAAAPDLLAALEWMVAHDDTNEGNEPVESLGGQTWSEYNAYWLAGLEQARAAIAKAKGESDGR